MGETVGKPAPAFAGATIFSQGAALTHNVAPAKAGQPSGICLYPFNAACAAANRAIGTRKGEAET
jgi:hypothetical protein